MINLVMDTNVLVAALMSRRGASNALLRLVGTGRFEISLSVALVLEYEEVTKRHGGEKIALTTHQIDDVIDYLCSVSKRPSLFYLWRPVLIDPDDDMILELAVNAGCDYIVTHNVHDFRGSERFGLQVVRPREMLQILEVL